LVFFTRWCSPNLPFSTGFLYTGLFGEGAQVVFLFFPIFPGFAPWGGQNTKSVRFFFLHYFFLKKKFFNGVLGGDRSSTLGHPPLGPGVGGLKGPGFWTWGELGGVPPPNPGEQAMGFGWETFNLAVGPTRGFHLSPIFLLLGVQAFPSLVLSSQWGFKPGFLNPLGGQRFFFYL